MLSRFDISFLTNVTDGGTPDLGDMPTSGLLANLSDSLIDFSDALVENKAKIEQPGTNSIYEFGTHLIDVIEKMTQDLNLLRFQILQMTSTQIPDELK